jgi:DNA-binding protein YbaB
MQKFVNNFSSAVAQTFGAGDIYLTLTAGDGSRLPTLDVDDFILLTLFRLSGVEESGHEVVKVTAVNTDQCTVVRAFEGAAASQFLIGDKIQARATAATLAAFEPKSASIQTHISSTSNPHGVTATQVGLSNVDNTSDANKPVSTAQQTALNLKANLASPTFTGTVGGITSAMVGLGSVDNTSDANKPVSTAQQTALNLKANLASPTFTGTVGGITSAMVGLGSVNNTSDANKPVSTAQQTALNLKADLASPTFTGTVGGITAAMVGAPSGSGTCSGTNTGDQDLSGKQDVLVSGTSIKTINSTSLLGSGNIATGDVTGQASSIDSEIALFSSTTGKVIKRATTTGLLKAASGVLSAATAGTDYVAPGTATTFTATQTFKGLGETQYNLTGTDIAVSNGTVQYKTLSGNTTFTESLADGQGVILMLNPATYTTTWPTTTWIGTVASTAPTLIASVYNCIVLFQMSGTLYGRYVGRV